MFSKSDIVNKCIEETIKVKMSFNKELKERILKVADAIFKGYKNKRHVFVFGNGGSAADAQHLAAELVGRFLKERDPLDIIALTTNSSLFSALINDYPPDEVFSRQVKAHVNKNDIVIGISTSGNSPNVIKGIKTAGKKGALTIGLTGESGGELGGLCDILLNVPSSHTPRIQEAHILIIHLICELVEKEME